jgi:uncharacterized protein (TIGR02145 family)
MKKFYIFAMLVITTLATAQAKKTTSGAKPAQTTAPKETSYPTVTIGNQVWMTKNLDVSTFRNGDPIPRAQTSPQWLKAISEKKPAWCYYQVPNADVKDFGNPEQSKKYGKLYNYYAISDPRGLAPKGWEIANGNEWNTLIQYVKDNVTQSELYFMTYITDALKSKSGWYNKYASVPMKQGLDTFGLNLLPAGSRDTNAFFIDIGSNAQFIINEPIFKNDRYEDNVEVFFLTEIDYSFGSLELDGSFSVRCVKAKEYEPTAQDYYNKGTTKNNAKDYNGAIEEYTKAINLSPDSFLCYYSRGNAKAWLNKWDEAKIDFEKSWKLIQAQNLYKDDNVKLVLFGLGNAYYNSNSETSCFYFNEAVKYGSEGAKEYVKKCNEEKVNELIKSGSTKLTNKDIKGAIEDFNKSIEFSPNKECGTCLSWKAYAEVTAENWNSAIVDYLRAWEIIKIGNYNDETKGNTLSSLAYSYFKVNNLDSACYFFKEAVKYKNTQSQEYVNKYCNKGEKVLEKEPGLQKGF